MGWLLLIWLFSDDDRRSETAEDREERRRAEERFAAALAELWGSALIRFVVMLMVGVAMWNLAGFMVRIDGGCGQRPMPLEQVATAIFCP